MRASRAACIAAVVSVIFARAAVAEQALEHDIWGYFRPAKRPPTAFANIAELHLAGRGEYGWKAAPPYFGMIKTSGKGGATFMLQQPVIDGLDIRFTTEAVRGVRYEFKGSLARGDFSRGGISRGEVMLYGMMRKLQDGRKINSAELRFAFEEGG